MRKIIKKMRTSWITVWLIIAAAALSTFIAYATYTGVTSVKRVVSTRAGAGILFSSNYMKHGLNPQGSIEYRAYNDFFDNEGNLLPAATDPTYTMTVCNFSQGDKATWCTSNDIRYTLTATLVLNEKYTSEDGVSESLIGTYKSPSASDLGDLKFGIKYSDDSDYTYFTSSNLSITLPTMGSYSLSKNDASTDLFSLYFDKREIAYTAPRFWIMITATPTTGSGGEVETISGYVGTCQSAKGGDDWTGYIGDENYTTVDYDSYNYIISGNGQGAFYFAWDDSKVKPNEFALANYSSDIEGNVASVTEWTGYTQYGTTAPSTGTWKYIKLNVDSEQTARYEIQLYKTSGDNYSSVISKYTDWYFVASDE